MTSRVSTPQSDRASTPLSPLARAVDHWLAEGRSQGHSERTIGNRLHLMGKFAWWLENEEKAEPTMESLTPATIRAFLTYLRQERQDGRFGSKTPGARRTVRPSTIHTYYRCLRAFANFSLLEGLLTETPLKNVKAPRVPNDQVQPFSTEQVLALLAAARQGRYPERDIAIISLLVDTGMRVSELCGLTVADFDRVEPQLSVVGKGNKRRSVYMGATSRRSLWRYVEAERKHARPEEALFIGVGGNRRGTGMTPSGVFHVVQTVGKAAGLKGVRCSPHTLRHTFAINFLRSESANLFELQQLMGHTDLTVLRRYVTLAESDLAAAHRKASPLDRMGAK